MSGLIRFNIKLFRAENFIIVDIDMNARSLFFKYYFNFSLYRESLKNSTNQSGVCRIPNSKSEAVKFEIFRTL